LVWYKPRKHCSLYQIAGKVKLSWQMVLRKGPRGSLTNGEFHRIMRRNWNKGARIAVSQGAKGKSCKRRLKMARTSMDLEENIAALLCYVVGWVTAIVFLVLEKENKFVRFHAFQSLLTFLPLSVLAWILGWIPFAGWVLAGLVWVLIVILWLILMFKAYKGEKYKLPIVGDLAERQTG